MGIAGMVAGSAAPGAAGAETGIVPRAGGEGGKLGGGATTSGIPETDAPGTRGKENTSLSPAKCGASAQGSVLPPSALPGGEDGIAARSEPLGGAVGGDAGTAGTPGKEYISAAGGIWGAAAQGPPGSALADDDDDGEESVGATVGAAAVT
ncbi:MAG: hypothetical protein WBV31_17935 [Terriglobales bacterium]